MLASTIKFSKHTPPKTPQNKNRETPRNHRETAATQETTDPSKPNSAPPQTWYKPTFHPETKNMTSPRKNIQEQTSHTQKIGSLERR